jgi:hypothetical protein
MGGGQDQYQQGKMEWQPIVYSYYADNITITGGGVIDGQGWYWWDCFTHAGVTMKLPCHGVSRRLFRFFPKFPKF